MVLLSETTTAFTATAIFGIYSWVNLKECIILKHHAGIISVCMLGLYNSVRLLLETESPQSIGPVFLAVVFLFIEILKRGKYYPQEFGTRASTLFILSNSVLFFVYFKGLVFLSEKAQKLPLDRELQWYHPLLMGASSWRNAVIVTIVCFIPVSIRWWGWILVSAKIVVLWVVYEATGKEVATSPWGALDEILLDRNSLLYLIFGLITFAIVMDQIAAIVVYRVTEKDLINNTTTEKIDWNDFKHDIRDRLFSLYRRETSRTSRASTSAAGTGYSADKRSSESSNV